MRRIFFREGDEIKLDFQAMILFAFEMGITDSELRKLAWSDPASERVNIR